MASEEGTAAGAERRPFQFTLRQLLGVMLGVCVLGASYSWIGGLLFGVLLGVGVASLIGAGFWCAIRLQWTGAFIALLCGVIIVLLLIPSVQSPRIATRQDYCRHNLRHIALALHNYHEAYGSLPPAYVADADGKPMHSWRVLLLPFLEQKNLYDAYDFNEPWDGPNNRKLAAEVRRLRVFECPAAATVGETSYVAVVGPQTMWPGEKGIKFSTVKDGMTNTLMVVEVHNSGIHWMEPRDLDVTQMAMVINPGKGRGISSGHTKGAMGVFVDGHVRWLPNDLPAETVRALLTRAGAETVPDW